jgi:hypothetical protein
MSLKHSTKELVRQEEMVEKKSGFRWHFWVVLLWELSFGAHIKKEKLPPVHEPLHHVVLVSRRRLSSNLEGVSALPPPSPTVSVMPRRHRCGSQLLLVPTASSVCGTGGLVGSGFLFSCHRFVPTQLTHSFEPMHEQE